MNIVIPNTIITPKYSNGSLRGYDIAPINGYVLHDRAGSWEDINPETGEPIFNRAYYYGSCYCEATYDFTTTQITIENGNTVTAYGNREFFAIPESEAPTEQIFNVPVKPKVM